MASTSTSLHNVSDEVLPSDSPSGQSCHLADRDIEPEKYSRYLPRYRFKIFKSKGAVLVLLWSFCILSVLNFIVSEEGNHNLLELLGSHVDPLIVFVMCTLVYPILGLIADVRCGRYQMIKWSLRMMWVLLFLLCLSSVLFESFHPTGFVKHTYIVRLIIYVPIAISMGGFQACVIQFGIDQLVDASTGEITSFLRWYSWVWFLSGAIQALSQSCLCFQYESIGYLLPPIFMTLAVVSDCFFNHWLIKEPSSDNPLVLIYKVLWYAVKHKYPHQRSAFTYFDDKPYSRIDLGKGKYGGPFTTEQVEDVKTFFRILSILVVGTFFISMFLSIYPIYEKVYDHLYNEHHASLDLNVITCEYSSLRNCFERTAIHYTGHFFLAVFLPLFEFFLYPFFDRCFKFIILRKASVAMSVIVSGLVMCTTIEFVANYVNHQSTNQTSCPLNETEVYVILPVDYKWMALPFTMNSLGQFLLLTSIGEFLCAQSPYSMKGFLFGSTYGLSGFFAIVGYLLLKPVKLISRKWLTNHYGCLSWYLLIALAFLLAVLLAFFFVFKCYKKRLRDDNVHNEQIFAINYYS